jgi:hypothetical protein
MEWRALLQSSAKMDETAFSAIVGSPCRVCVKSLYVEQSVAEQVDAQGVPTGVDELKMRRRAMMVGVDDGWRARGARVDQIEAEGARLAATVDDLNAEFAPASERSLSG